MFRFNRVACALSVCLLVGAAFGAAVKIRSFDVVPGTEAAGADGMAILNYVSGQDETIVQIILSDFTPGPDVNYFFTLKSPSHCKSPGGVISTDAHGHGTVHSTFDAPLFDPNCPLANDGDWSDSDIVITLGGVEHACGENPTALPEHVCGQFP